jgi:hypothetical protein|tara:strand:- start:890 stop:1168 length:279 start_codon:yes stop_codon:yes gene_type:complete
MDWSTSTVALGVFLSTQLGAAVWWASETDTKVERNTVTISQVADNATDIAVIQNDVIAIKNMMEENEERVKELREMMNQILYSYRNAVELER